EPVPDDGGLALIGDPDGSDVIRGEIGPAEGDADSLAHTVPDLHRVVFHPPGAGEQLTVLELARRDHAGAAVDDDRPRACGSLVYRHHILGASHARHRTPPPVFFTQPVAFSSERSASTTDTALLLAFAAEASS